MIIKKIQNKDDLAKLYTFIMGVNVSVGSSILFKDYMYMYNNGIAYSILNRENGSVIGGCLISENSGMNELFNLYIPENNRNAWGSMYKEIRKYVCNTTSKYVIFQLDDTTNIRNNISKFPHLGDGFYKIKMCKEQ